MTGMSDFGWAAARLDMAEYIAGERAGGPNEADDAAIAIWERRLASLQPVTAQDWRWLAGRLARALENEWGEAALASLLAPLRFSERRSPAGCDLS